MKAPTPHRPTERVSASLGGRPTDRGPPARFGLGWQGARGRAITLPEREREREGSGRDACRISGDGEGGRYNGGEEGGEGEREGGADRILIHKSQWAMRWAGLVRHSYRWSSAEGRREGGHALLTRFYRAEKKSLYVVARMSQASSGRSDKQGQ